MLALKPRHRLPRNYNKMPQSLKTPNRHSEELELIYFRLRVRLHPGYEGSRVGHVIGGACWRLSLIVGISFAIQLGEDNRPDAG